MINSKWGQRAMHINRRFLIALAMLALAVCGGLVIRYAHPGHSEQARLAIVGRRWFDPLGRNLRLYDLSGHRIGEYWLHVDNIRDIGASTRGNWLTVLAVDFEPTPHYEISVFDVDSLVWIPVVLQQVTGMSWSSDETQIALVVASSESGSPAQAIRIVSASCLEAGRDCIQESQYVRTGLDAAWSPDGTRLAFVSLEQQIGILSLDDHSERILPHNKTREECWRSKWSPTRRYVGYVCGEDLYVYDLDQEIERKIPLMSDLTGMHYQWLSGVEDIMIIEGWRKGDVSQDWHWLWHPEVDVASTLYQFRIETGPIDRLLQGDDLSIRNWVVLPGSQ